MTLTKTRTMAKTKICNVKSREEMNNESHIQRQWRGNRQKKYRKEKERKEKKKESQRAKRSEICANDV